VDIPQILVKFCLFAIVKLVALPTNFVAWDNSESYVCIIAKGSVMFPPQPYVLSIKQRYERLVIFFIKILLCGRINETNIPIKGIVQFDRPKFLVVCW
jgi:hypothetical protein